MHSTEFKTEQLLGDIINKAKAIVAIPLARPPPSPNRDSFEVTLPDPPSLLPLLIRAGAHETLALAMDQAYMKRAAELRKLYSASISKICSDRLSSMDDPQVSKIVSTFTVLYTNKLQSGLEEGLAAFRDRATAQQAARTGHKSLSPSFNHEYVPLLEHFFEENPFPTHADKVFLAKKSRMTYRQIHVWFQNRRNRTKKEGKALRRKPMAEGAMLPLDGLYQRMGRYIIIQESCALKESSRRLTRGNTSPSKNIPTVINILDGHAAPHAFPSPYPPICTYKPFPTEGDRFQFESPNWRRHHSSQPSRPYTVDLADLTEKFSLLNVRDDHFDRTRKGADRSAATIAITVKCSPAPHPACIRQISSSREPRPSPLPTIPASKSSRHVFNSPSPRSEPLTLVPTPSPLKRNEPGRRKVAPLPRRIPRADRATHSGIIPVVERSTRSSSPPSRIPSFSSDTSGNLSPSGDSSSVSSECATPHSISAPLSRTWSPVPFMSPACLQGSFDSENALSESWKDLISSELETSPHFVNMPIPS